MSIAPLLTKCFSSSKAWAGQAVFGHRCIASDSGFTTQVPHSGQVSGIWNTLSCPMRTEVTGPRFAV